MGMSQGGGQSMLRFLRSRIRLGGWVGSVCHVPTAPHTPRDRDPLLAIARPTVNRSRPVRLLAGEADCVFAPALVLADAARLRDVGGFTDVEVEVRRDLAHEGPLKEVKPSAPKKGIQRSLSAKDLEIAMRRARSVAKAENSCPDLLFVQRHLPDMALGSILEALLLQRAAELREPRVQLALKLAMREDLVMCLHSMPDTSPCASLQRDMVKETAYVMTEEPCPTYEPPRLAWKKNRNSRQLPISSEGAACGQNECSKTPFAPATLIGVDVMVLSDYFSTFGTLTDVVVMTDRGTGRSRGFGFVSYETPEPVDAIMSMHKEHNIMGKWIDCKPATAEGTKGAPSKGGGKDFGKGMPKGMGKDRAGDWKGGKPDGSYGAKSYGGYAAFPPPAGCGGSGCGAYGGAAAAGAYGGGCGGYAGGCAGYGAFGGYGGAGCGGYDACGGQGGYGCYGAAPHDASGGKGYSPY
ncbi:unnamed protein product [Symbiodinium sp. CCMP2592]|nr:unnamed protein product [Symbiodinium sp. CCMP2592]